MAAGIERQVMALECLTFTTIAICRLDRTLLKLEGAEAYRVDAETDRDLALSTRPPAQKDWVRV